MVLAVSAKNLLIRPDPLLHTDWVIMRNGLTRSISALLNLSVVVRLLVLVLITGLLAP